VVGGNCTSCDVAWNVPEDEFHINALANSPPSFTLSKTCFKNFFGVVKTVVNMLLI
jgi:hypothetical protein